MKNIIIIVEFAINNPILNILVIHTHEVKLNQRNIKNSLL